MLDNTGVHPESYDVARKLLARYGYTEADVKACKLDGLKDKVKLDGINNVATELGVGEMTLSDIIDEITQPGRDIRDSLPPAVLRADLMDINDLKEGMELTGVVRNVIDFGAFVDIGVHHDGLVHVSEISDRYIKHPSEALTVGQTVKVKVIGVDYGKQRINLSIKGASGYVSERATEVIKVNNGAVKDRNKNAKDNNKRSFNQSAKKKEDNLSAMLQALQNKYNKK